MEKKEMSVSFLLRMIHNQTRDVIHKTFPKENCECKAVPQSQLQGGILGYLYHQQDKPIYQKDIEREFRITGATATNTLRVMEKNGLIVRKSLDKDARLKRILMTEEASTNHARVEAHMKMMNEKMVEGLSKEDVARLREYLQTIMCNLEKLKGEEADGEAEERNDSDIE